MSATLSPADLVSRVNRDVERSLMRARNGIRYLRGTRRPTLGATPKEVVVDHLHELEVKDRG